MSQNNRAAPKTIEGVAVTHHYEPESIEALAEAVASGANGDALFPIGGATALDYGNPPSRPGAALATHRLGRIDDYPHEDMTITVETGISMAELSRVLAKHGQQAPIDVAEPDRATLGGCLATAACGPRRYGYGTPRDYVLGIDVVNAQGQRVHAGGRVVKNVAGYDLMKLHTGALGTLGVIVQATLRLRPAPEARAALHLGLDDAQIEPTLAQLNASATRPVAIELLNRSAVQSLELPISHSDAKPWTLIVLFEEATPAVAWQLEQCRAELASMGAGLEVAQAPEVYEQLLSQLTAFGSRNEDELSLKATMAPGAVAEFCQITHSEFPDLAVKAHAGTGIVHATLPNPAWEQSETLISHWRQWTSQRHGSLTIPRCPTAWKRQASVWGEPRGDWPLMLQLKKKLDPADRLNPGRFIAAHD